MTLQQRPRSEALLAASPPGRRWWNWQRLMQGIWIVLALVLLVSFVANIPAFYQSALAGCTLSNPGDCPTGLLTPGNFQALAQLHLPILVVASFFATLTVGVSVLYWLVGLLIFWRKSQEWTGLIFSLTYDASRILTSFSTTLRTEVDVDILHEQLLNVVQETMQPTHISLWVCQPSRTETPSLQVSELPRKES